MGPCRLLYNLTVIAPPKNRRDLNEYINNDLEKSERKTKKNEFPGLI
jgi:hypothetical protein